MPHGPLRFSTLGLAPAASVAALRSFLGEVYYDLDVTSHEERVVASIVGTNVGGLRITRHVGGATGVERLGEKARRDAVAFHVMLLPIAGPLWFRQHGREGVVAEGGAVLLRSAEPYELESRSFTDHVCFLMPGDLLSSHVPGIDDLCAVALAPGHPFLLPLIRLAVGALDAVEAAPLPARTERVCVDLAALVLESAGAGAPRIDSASAVRLFSFLDCSFRDNRLRLGEVARECGMSTRSLQRLLRGRGTSFAAEVRERRLREADRLLRAPAGEGSVSIGEIAHVCGFASQSHLSAAYRARYGVSPSSARAEHRASTLPDLLPTPFGVPTSPLASS